MTKEEIENHTTLDTDQCKWWVITLFSMAKSLACQTNNFDDAKEIQSAQDKIIKALEQQENKGTVALIEPSQKTTLRQLMQPSDDCISLEVYKQVIHERDIAIEQLKELGYELGEKIETSNDCVSRADVRKIAKEMYLEIANMHLDVHTISDCISYTSSKCRQVLEDKLQSLPPVTPTIGNCKDCKHKSHFEGWCNEHTEWIGDMNTYYCADFERRKE